MSQIKLMAMLAFVLMMSGCATVAERADSQNYCRFNLRVATVAQPPAGGGDHDLVTQKEPDNAMLLMSGGSQHGAFGAGLLGEWARLDPKGFPNFKVVTGISTGAMVSTFAFIGKPEVAEKAYDIPAEGVLLKPYARKSANGSLSLLSYVSILRHGAVADLSPLHEFLWTLITPEVLKAVVQKSYHRTLEVGAVDVDSGDAVMFDLVGMAKKFVDASDAATQNRYRDCYVKAIIASGSAPFAAKPVFIDNREYMDGGARFGVFIDDFGSVAHAPPAKSVVSDRAVSAETRPVSSPLPVAPSIYIIVNGTQLVAPQCGKINAKDCGKDGTDPYNNLDGQHKKWDLLSLGMRTAEDILPNQVYRFSVADIAARFHEAYPNARSLFYYPINGQKSDVFLDPTDPAGKTTCRDRYDADLKNLRPIQFFPNYMRCLEAYGRNYARVNQADLLLANAAPSLTTSNPR